APRPAPRRPRERPDPRQPRLGVRLRPGAAEAGDPADPPEDGPGAATRRLRLALARIAKGGGDARDRAAERESRALGARAVAAQELDLDRVHRVDVGVPDPDRPPDHRAPLEQPFLADDGENRAHSALVLGGDVGEERLGAELLGHELEVLAGDL